MLPTNSPAETSSDARRGAIQPIKLLDSFDDMITIVALYLRKIEGPRQPAIDTSFVNTADRVKLGAHLMACGLWDGDSSLHARLYAHMASSAE